MTYNEWKDELKSNLLCVSDSERRRVLDYYAEAYADRRDAGFTEREIIEDFGAPYDAAKRILAERDDEYPDAARDSEKLTKRDFREFEKRQKEEIKREEKETRYSPPPSEPQPQYQPQPKYQPQPPVQQRENLTWVFVLLCVVLCIPILSLILSMVIVTVSLCLAPFGVMFAGVLAIGGGIATMIENTVAGGLATTAIGLMFLGVSIILIPLFIKLVALMWKAFKTFFSWLKSLFSGKGVRV